MLVKSPVYRKRLPTATPCTTLRIRGRRSARPSSCPTATARREADRPQFLSGLVGNVTCGAPLTAVIPNTDTRSEDYANLRDCPRPGHADYTAQIKYGGFQDVAGGGHFSGRLTAPLCIAGGLCKQWLEAKGIRIAARLAMVAGIEDGPIAWDPVDPDLSAVGDPFPVLNAQAGERMRQAIAEARADADSVGGIIECVACPQDWAIPCSAVWKAGLPRSSTAFRQ